MHNGHSHLLLVEDNPSDLRLTKEAFQDLEPLVILDAVSDGVEALAFLRREALTSVPFALVGDEAAIGAAAIIAVVLGAPWSVDLSRAGRREESAAQQGKCEQQTISHRSHFKSP
jgi:CheY-like chemotaxis protein